MGLSEAQVLSAYYSGRNSYAVGESKHGPPETEPTENREEETIGSRIKYSIKTESIKAVERYKCWQAAKAVTRWPDPIHGMGGSEEPQNHSAGEHFGAK